MAARLFGVLTSGGAEIADAARETAEAHRMERTAERYFELYEQLIGRSRKQGVGI